MAFEQALFSLSPPLSTKGLFTGYIIKNNSNILSWYKQVISIKRVVLSKQFLRLRRAKEVIIGRR